MAKLAIRWQEPRSISQPMRDACWSIARAGGSIGRRTTERTVLYDGQKGVRRRVRRSRRWCGGGETIAQVTITAMLDARLAVSSFASGSRRVELTAAGALAAFRENERRLLLLEAETPAPRLF